MWNLPGPGLEPVSPALAGRFLTTAPPGKPLAKILKNNEATVTVHAALFTIAKLWKKPQCPSTDEWIKKWYIYNRILLSHKTKQTNKRNKTETDS